MQNTTQYLQFHHAHYELLLRESRLGMEYHRSSRLTKGFRPSGHRNACLLWRILAIDKLALLVGHRQVHLCRNWGLSTAPAFVSHKVDKNGKGKIKWKHFPRYWPFVRGIHRSPVNSSYKGQWRGALMFYFICAWINAWVNNHEVGDLRRHHAHYDVILMPCQFYSFAPTRCGSKFKILNLKIIIKNA